MVKVLVSTLLTQGERDSDYSFVPEGELVGRYGVVCDAEKIDGSGGCGCGRGFAGFTTHRATTTAVVSESDLSREQWMWNVRRVLRSTGWSAGLARSELDSVVAELAEFDLDLVAGFAVGTVVGRRAWNDRSGLTTDLLYVRRAAAAAPRLTSR